MPVAPNDPGSCASFGWLWLTDLHQGQHGQRWLWPTFREEFFKDIDRLHDKCGPWDFVLFTGDLVYSGAKQQFDVLDETIEELWNRFRSKGSNPSLLCVPGNHDLQRPPPDAAVALALRGSWGSEEVQKAFWERPNSEYRKLVNKTLKAYTVWCDSRAALRPPDFRPGLLPGEFSATVAKGAARFGIIGLNTTFLQLGAGNYQGQLQLDPRQLHIACSGDAAAWIKQRHICFLLTHHPTDWLSDQSQDHFRGGIYPPGRFAAHFYGHMHESAGQELSEGGAQPRRSFQGCSLFGLERYGEAFEKERLKFGYAAGRLEIHKDKAYLRLWPRRAEKHQAGHWHIVPDHSYTLQADDSTVPQETSLTIPCDLPSGTLPPGAAATSAADAASGIDLPAASARRQYLEKTHAESMARCVMRWQGAGVSRDLARELAQDPTVGAPSPEMTPHAGKVIVLLTGDMGAGKSLTGERIHQAAISRARVAPDAPTPVYLEAPAALGHLAELVDRTLAASGGTSECGAAVFLQEAIGGETADIRRLLDEARFLVEARSNTTVVLLSRNTRGVERMEESVSIPLRSQQQAVSLIERLTGNDLFHLHFHTLPPSIQETVRRPLYAVLLSTYLRDANIQSPRSTADLVANLVKRALDQVKVDPASVSELLQRLAALLTDRGGGFVPTAEVGPDDQLRPLVDSGLLVERTGAISFPLAIQTEWFAARSLAAGYPAPGDLAGNAKRLDRWYYALAVAVSSFSHEVVSRILAPVAEQDPALASMLVEEGVPRWGTSEDILPPPTMECGQRLRELTQIWLRGLGPVAPVLGPVRPDGTLQPLGVTTSRAWLRAGWYFGGDISTPIVQLPDVDVTQGLTQPPPEGWSIRDARPGQCPAWAWRWTRDDLIDWLTKAFRRRRLHPQAGLILQESAWLAALALAGNPHRAPRAISLKEVAELLPHFKDYGAVWDNRRRILPLEPLRIEVQRLQRVGELELRPPWPPKSPAPNPVYPETWWQARSDEEIRDRVTVVYEAAIEGYQKMVETWFPRFAHRLSNATMLPARLIGNLFIPARNEGGNPILDCRWEALPHGQRSSVEISLVDEMPRWAPTNADDTRPLYDHFRAVRPDVTAPWLRVRLRQIGFADVFRPDASMELAYQWLWNDLCDVEWGQGNL